MMRGEDTDGQDALEAQFQTATEGLQRAVMRLLQDRDIHPHVMVLALARVTGEVGAGTASTGGRDPEELPGELAEAVREAGREFREMLQAEALPTAGNAWGDLGPTARQSLLATRSAAPVGPVPRRRLRERGPRAQ